jgi:hypothetical protein
MHHIAKYMVYNDFLYVVYILEPVSVGGEGVDKNSSLVLAPMSSSVILGNTR